MLFVARGNGFGEEDGEVPHAGTEFLDLQSLEAQLRLVVAVGRRVQVAPFDADQDFGQDEANLGPTGALASLHFLPGLEDYFSKLFFSLIPFDYENH